MCVYCGGVADTSDHTPPRAFLPRKLPQGIQAMTIPACRACNAGYSQDEVRAAAVVSTVSFTASDRRATAPGGWLHTAMNRDQALARFIADRMGDDGIFQVDEIVVKTLSRVMIKSAVGLIFFEFGRIVPRDHVTVLAIEHAKNVVPEAMMELFRCVDGGWAEVTPSGRELEREVMAVAGIPPRHTTPWKIYVPDFFEYNFLRRSNNTLLCAMKLHEALTVLVECPWPSRAGPRRRGKP